MNPECTREGCGWSPVSVIELDLEDGETWVFTACAFHVESCLAVIRRALAYSRLPGSPRIVGRA